MLKLLKSYFHQSKDLKQSLLQTISRLQGAFALGILSEEEPGKIYLAKKASPLVIGLGHNELLFASDALALLDHTKEVVFLEDQELACLSLNGVEYFKFSGESFKKKSRFIDLNWSRSDKEGYKHYMQKEIHQQPQVTHL